MTNDRVIQKEQWENCAENETDERQKESGIDIKKICYFVIRNWLAACSDSETFIINTLYI